jgi:hypothetical protein
MKPRCLRSDQMSIENEILPAALCNTVRGSCTDPLHNKAHLESELYVLFLCLMQLHDPALHLEAARNLGPYKARTKKLKESAKLWPINNHNRLNRPISCMHRTNRELTWSSATIHFTNASRNVCGVKTEGPMAWGALRAPAVCCWTTC